MGQGIATVLRLLLHGAEDSQQQRGDDLEPTRKLLPMLRSTEGRRSPGAALGAMDQHSWRLSLL